VYFDSQRNNIQSGRPYLAEIPSKLSGTTNQIPRFPSSRSGEDVKQKRENVKG
jgi:hypothetical protein